MKHQHLIGTRFNRLTPIRRLLTGYQQVTYLCQCSCGSTCVVAGASLVSNNTKSCGCLFRDTVRSFSRTHGQSNTRAYTIWASMKQRCLNPNVAAYKYYGGRGVKVCDDWLQFSRFLADMGQPTPRAKLERIDNNGNYQMDNCRWATSREQSRNTRWNVILSFDGKTMCLKDWSIEVGRNYPTLLTRAKRWGNKPEWILFAPPHTRLKALKRHELQAV